MLIVHAERWVQLWGKEEERKGGGGGDGGTKRVEGSGLREEAAHHQGQMVVLVKLSLDCHHLLVSLRKHKEDDSDVT